MSTSVSTSVQNYTKATKLQYHTHSHTPKGIDKHKKRTVTSHDIRGQPDNQDDFSSNHLQSHKDMPL